MVFLSANLLGAEISGSPSVRRAAGDGSPFQSARGARQAERIRIPGCPPGFSFQTKCS